MRRPRLKRLFDEIAATLAAVAFAEENEPATARQLSSAGALAPDGEPSRGWTTGARTP